VNTGAGIARLGVEWPAIVGSERPADPTNPGSASYNFSSIDPAVRGARARGLAVLLTVNHAPDWAEGAGRPANAYPHTWKPNPSDLADFVRAVAARYSGGFDPDGAGPAPPLPAAQALQVWNEPNQEFFLSPAYDYVTTVLGTPGLLSYWRLGEATGSTAVDSKGSNNGTYTGGFTLGKLGIPGGSDTSVRVDGSSGYLSTPTNPGGVQGTIEFWGYANDLGSRNGVVYTADDGTSTYSHQIGVLPDGSVRLHLSDGSARIADTAPGLITANTWHYYALVWSDGGSADLYVDGTKRASVAIGSSWEGGDKLLFGHAAGAASGLTNPWQGRIDEAAVYNQALSATTIQQHYNSGQGTTAFSPDHYRLMLNASYQAVKAVNPQMLVVTAGTSAYGDPPGGPYPDPNNRRIRPVTFWQQVLSEKTLFDVFAHQPINNIGGGPLQSAPDPGDATTPDLGRVVNVLRAAESAGTTLPGTHPVWVTEFWWDSNPPNSVGVPLNTQAAWIEQALYLFWKAGASTAMDYQLGDINDLLNVRAGFQSGPYFIDGKAKPSLTAFRFPFVTERIDTQTLRAWGKAPAGGTLSIQRQQGSKWVTFKKLQVNKGAVFITDLGLSGATALRATVGNSQSLVWQQG
jgi:hypothetical protein